MIVVGVDGSVAARAAVEWAAADALRTREPLRLVHAVDRTPYQIGRFPTPTLPDVLLREGRRILDEAVALVRERQPQVEVETREVEGAPALVLREEAEGASGIVVGSRGLGGFAGALLGSVSTHVAGHVRCPVVVVRAQRQPVSGEIVVGVDDSPECRPALAYAFRQAELRGAKLRAVHAWQLPVHAFAPEIAYDVDEIRVAQQQLLTGALESFRAEHPAVEIIEETHSGHPVDVLTAAGAQADLVVVGSHGRGAMGSALLGSVSRGVLHHARCAVAVVR
ncbi:universal stress protein [Nonomuraea wenchangensis]|uniref:Nucleotide-binding universal stress protein, UspA family n=1 Tax=Nonomuraea wenchangensis TaxID=568860 RepID=A0A1I0KP62_9ACTN|nr:universal stress protein [Nonomuraea wenchangensis]SEU26417.1 Nucleotide-binding universal stress protein, UspA family [Nonomuraea wenchangensis]